MKDVKRGDMGLLILRIGLGLIMIYYGSQQFFGVFGGSGYTTTIANMQSNYGIHPVLANLAMVANFFGGIAVLLGFVTPLASFAVAASMAVAFYLNLIAPDAIQGMLSNRDAARVFFPFMLFIAAFSLMFTGAGKLSLDNKLFRTGK